eukprot:scaffold5105_cov161-Ochromonas_danica.AAC.3
MSVSIREAKEERLGLPEEGIQQKTLFDDQSRAVSTSHTPTNNTHTVRGTFGDWDFRTFGLWNN